MQTFVPYTNNAKSAQVLDRQRLGKQRVEVLQILRALAGETKGWVNHPATKMWRGHELALIEYGLAVCEEWVSRGYKDTCADRIRGYREVFSRDTAKMPSWWRGAIHMSHRSNLVRKRPDIYGELWRDVDPDAPYVWPVPTS